MKIWKITINRPTNFSSLSKGMSVKLAYSINPRSSTEGHALIKKQFERDYGINIKEKFIPSNLLDIVQIG